MIGSDSQFITMVQSISHRSLAEFSSTLVDDSPARRCAIASQKYCDRSLFIQSSIRYEVFYVRLNTFL